jgi:DNA-binding transcriptional ArsR family regulator
MIDVTVIDDAEAAVIALDESRARMLAALSEPMSAATLAAASGWPRQRVNYHLRELESHGLVELVEERRKGNMTERVMQSTARSFVISPAALAAVAPDPSRSPDRLSASWLLAVASQLVRDVGMLMKGAARSRQRLATFTMDTEIRFASAGERAAFATELADAVARLAAKYHDESASAGRDHHLVIAVHPNVSPAGRTGTRPPEGT